MGIDQGCRQSQDGEGWSNVYTIPVPYETRSSPAIYDGTTLKEQSSQTNVILPYKLLASILSAVCSVIQQS